MSRHGSQAGIFKAAEILFACLAVLFSSGALLSAETVTIGVLAKRGADKAMSKWFPTALYLTTQLPEYRFQIKPLTFSEINDAVSRHEVDFILVNSGIYVSLESRFNVSRIATLKNRIGDKVSSHFGGVIFTRADSTEIKSLKDLQNKTMAAVDPTSLGGFQMAWREMKDAGLDPFEDLAGLQFAGTHDAVVYAVLKGEVQVGTVRTDTLERMADEGKIQLDSLKVLSYDLADDTPAFETFHSTRLYPEWPIARLEQTPLELAEKVSRALLDMSPYSVAAVQSRTAGWTIPLNYKGVHELFRELQLPPYEPRPVTIQAFFMQHKLVVFLIFGGLAVTVLFAFNTVRINHGLKVVTASLEKTRNDLEVKVSERTAELLEKEEELETLIENLPSMVFVKDAEDLHYVHFNRAGEELLGISREQLIGFSDYDLFPLEQAELFAARDRQVLESGEVLNIDEEQITTHKGMRYFHTRKVCLNDATGHPRYLVGISNDITESKEYKDRLDHLATHDSLTGLFNRRVLEERLQDEMNRVQRYGFELSVFMLDIDYFKQVNDTYGHHAGDEVLRHLSKLMQESIRKSDFAARYGGEEFSIVLPITPQAEAIELAERLREKISRLVIPVADNKTISVTISIGVASARDVTRSWEELLDTADNALYRAKESGRNRVKAEAFVN